MEKSVILLEMVILAGGGLLNVHTNQHQTWEQTLLKGGLKRLIAVLILTVLLLALTDVGLGTAAAAFGGLVSLGYVLGAIGWLGPAVQSAEQQLFA